MKKNLVERLCSKFAVIEGRHCQAVVEVRVGQRARRALRRALKSYPGGYADKDKRIWGARVCSRPDDCRVVVVGDRGATSSFTIKGLKPHTYVAWWGTRGGGEIRYPFPKKGVRRRGLKP